MEYAELHPSGPLGLWVRRIWSLRASLVAGAGFEPVVPDGCMELILNLADPFERAHGGRTERQASALIAGQMLGPAWIRPTGRVDLLGIRLQPWGSPGLLDLPPGDLAEQIVPADLLMGRAVRELAEELSEIEDLRGRCARLADRLVAVLPPPNRCSPPAPVVALARGSVRSVSRAAELAGISTRQLERQCRRWIGVAPAQLLQLVRCQRALQRLRSRPDLSLARIAQESGFADQAHLTRELRRLAGQTPAQFRAAAGDLTTIFVEPGDLAGGEDGPR